MDYTLYFADHPALLVGMAAIIGLVVGSFLNVVIHRLPIMLETQWRRQCDDILGTDDDPAPPFNLLTPRSRCPHCQHTVGALENIPLISYLLLRGRCRHCSAPISPQYPLVELLSGILTGIVVLRFGFTWEAVAAMVLTWALVALSVIDLRVQLLPDVITLPILWLGILAALFGLFANLSSSVIGAMTGYLSLWLLYHVFRFATGKEGMGHGDFKLLALLGAWLGWQNLPAVVILSSFVGAVIGITLVLLRGRDRNVPMPFGPFLATAGWLTLLWGEQVNGLYLRMVGLA